MTDSVRIGLAIAAAPYEDLAHVAHGSDSDVIWYASKVFGERITKAQFDRAIKALPGRGP
jgi:hypothetical protein